MATSAWFNYNAYMANKLAQLVKAEPYENWDMTKLVQVFAEAGFAGAEGAEKHFEQFGQLEDVGPNAFFNATEYYRAKAAQLYEKAPKDVTDLDVAAVKMALKDAGLSAWGHYEQYGNAEGVNPSNSFDTEAYMNAKLTALNAVKDGKQWTMDELNAALKNAGLSALEHFMMYGGSGDGEVAQKFDGKVPAAFAVPEDKKVTPDADLVGKTYILSSGIDNITGTANNDTFVAASTGTLNLGDTLNGGAGTDTLKIYASGGATGFATADIKGIEVVQMIGSASTDVINVSGNADVEELWFVGGTVGTATLSVDQKLGFSGAVTSGTVTYVDVTGTDDSATRIYNGHTTTSDALWAGVPVVTAKGGHFASRVSASLLQACGLPELIGESMEEMAAIAVDLAKNPEKLSALRRTVEENRFKYPLFDTERFTRHFELGLQAAAQRAKDGLPPDHIDVPVLPSRIEPFMTAVRTRNLKAGLTAVADVALERKGFRQAFGVCPLCGRPLGAAYRALALPELRLPGEQGAETHTVYASALCVDHCQSGSSPCGRAAGVPPPGTCFSGRRQF